MDRHLISRIEDFAKWFSTLGSRERWLATVVVILLSGAIFEWTLFKPERARLAAAHVHIDEVNKQIEQTRNIIAQKQLDPESLAKLRQTQETELKALTERVARASDFLDSQGQTKVSAADLVRRLSRTGNAPRLTTLRVEPATELSSTPSTPATPAPSAQSAPAQARPVPQTRFYRVGVGINLKGDYRALVSYLARLERDMKGLIWSSAQLESSQYPDIKLNTVIYTLSTSDTPLTAAAN